jgi:hypothetical protein
MSEARNHQYNEPKEGQHGLLRDDHASLEQPSSNKKLPLSKETLDALEQLGEVLRGIYKRMNSEGYEIIDGKICKKMPENIHA